MKPRSKPTTSVAKEPNRAYQPAERVDPNAGPNNRKDRRARKKKRAK